MDLEQLDPFGLGFNHEDDSGEALILGNKKLTQKQLERLRQLQDPNAMYDEMGNVLQAQEDITARMRAQKTTYFIFKSWKMPLKQYVRILIFFLVIALFMERFCFVVAIYKGKNYGYILILLVFMFNACFLGIIQRARQNKNKKRLFELYDTDAEPNVNCCVMVFIG